MPLYVVEFQFPVQQPRQFRHLRHGDRTMLSGRNIAKLISLAILVIALVLLWLGPYREYCSGNYAKGEYCAVYRMSVAFGDFLDTHGGAITSFATVAIALFTWTL